MVVEVEKIVRDLSMLHKTIKMAKFYRILIGSVSNTSLDTVNQSLDVDRFAGEGNQERVV